MHAEMCPDEFVGGHRDDPGYRGHVGVSVAERDTLTFEKTRSVT